MAVGALLNPQSGRGMSSKLVFTPFCSCGTSPHCDLPGDIRVGSISQQHSRFSQCSIRAIKSSLLKLRGNLGTTSAALFQDQLTTKAHVSKPGLFTSIPVAADSAETFPYSAGREKVKFVWFLSCECLDCSGEQNSSAVGVLMPLK